VIARPGLAWAAVLLWASACGRETYRNADLQLDILAPLPAAADQVRGCIGAVGARTVGAGGPLYAIPGLPAQQAAAVTVDVLVPRDDATDSAEWGVITIARSAQVTLDADTPFRETELEVFAASAEQAQLCDDCPEPCTTSGSFGDEEEETWLLAVRFES